MMFIAVQNAPSKHSLFAAYGTGVKDNGISSFAYIPIMRYNGIQIRL